MDESSWQEVKRVFGEALELGAKGREGLLKGAAPEIRAEVEHLLEAHENAGARAGDGERKPEGPGSVIGRYKILQQIGEGGFGVVYMAEQEEPVRRKVALKVIKLGMDTGQVIARFEAERQALALMDHPNIAKVLDAGATGTGRPYFVMELVKGIPISEYCDKASLDTRERLGLFTKVCRAIQHAHRKGIIHRDLKPTNVLVTLHDGKPVPMVIDFGIAKATDRRLTEKTLFTEFAQMIGTPEYMAPEQAELSSLDIDTRADVYSLGVLLYELLTGSKPFELKTLLKEGWGEILRHIREVDPPKPSTRLSTMGDDLSAVAKKRHTQPKLLGKLVKGDLDWIVMKALEKDRSRRYDSADAMAQDVERYLEDEPVLATPPSRLYKLRKYVKRHKVGVAAVAAVFLALVAGLVLSAMGFMEASRQRSDAIAERDAAKEARAAEAEARSAADRAAEQALSERDEKEAARADLAKALTRSEGTRLIAQSQTILPRDPSLAVLLAIEGAERAPGFEASQALLDAMEKAPYREVVLDAGPCRVAEFGPRGERVATGHADGNVRICDAETGKVVRVLDADGGPVNFLHWAHERNTIVAVSHDGDVTVWNAASGESQGTIRSTPGGKGRRSGWGCWIAKNGSRCVLNPPEAPSRVVNLETGEVEFEIPGRFERAWAISDDGGALLTEASVLHGVTATLRCWDLESRKPVHSWSVSLNSIPTFSPDGKHALAKGPGGGLQLLDLETGAVNRGYEESERGVSCRGFVPDGRRIVLGHGDTVRILETATGRVCREISGVRPTLYQPRISPDGERIILLVRDPAPRFDIYCISTGEILATLPARNSYSRNAFSPDGRRILGFSPGGRATVRSLGPAPLSMLGRGALEFRAYGPDDRRAVSSTFFANAPVRVWDLERRRPAVSLEGHQFGVGDGSVYGAFVAGGSPDGGRVVTAGPQGEVLVWDASNGRILGGFRAHRAPVWSAGFSPDGTRIHTSAQDGTTRVWEAGTGAQLLVLGDEQPWGTAGRARNMAVGCCWAEFSPDGTKILTRNAGVDGVQVWDAQRGRLIHHLAASANLWGAGFSRDGTRVVTSEYSTDGGVTRTWDLESGECGLTLTGFAYLKGGPCSALSSDGKYIALAVKSEGLRICDLLSGDRVREIRWVLEGTANAYFSPDGRYVAASSLAAGRVVAWKAVSGAAVLDREHVSQLNRPPVFTPDSRALIVTLGSGLRVVPLDPLAEARAHRPRGFTDAERARYDIAARPAAPKAPARAAAEDPFEMEARAVEDLRRVITGVLEESRGREEAERRLRMTFRVIGIPEVALVRTLHTMGERSFDSGEYDVAESLLRSANQYGRRTLGPEHALVDQVNRMLADTLSRNGRPEEAEMLLRELVESSNRRFGTWLGEMPLLSLGRSLLAQDRPAEAEPVLRDGLRIAELNYSGNPWPALQIAMARSLLGDALLRQDRWKDAERELLAAWEQRGAPGSRMPSFEARTIERFVRLYEGWGKPEKAEEWRAKAKEAAGNR